MEGLGGGGPRLVTSDEVEEGPAELVPGVGVVPLSHLVTFTTAICTCR